MKLQKGTRIDKRIVFADVRSTVIRVGFRITEKFYDELVSIAPNAFAGSLRLVF